MEVTLSNTTIKLLDDYGLAKCRNFDYKIKGKDIRDMDKTELGKLAVEIKKLKDLVDERADNIASNLHECLLQLAYRMTDEEIGDFGIPDVGKFKLSTILTATVKDEEKFYDYLRKMGYGNTIQTKTSVHHKTRDSILTKLYQGGETIPQDIVACNFLPICKITKTY